MMWILGADADESAGEESLERVSGLIQGHGGEVLLAETWGRRTLAYPIRHNTEGSYFLAQFKLEPELAAALGKDMNADQSVIRHLVVRIEEEELTPAAPSRTEGQGAPA